MVLHTHHNHYIHTKGGANSIYNESHYLKWQPKETISSSYEKKIEEVDNVHSKTPKFLEYINISN